VLPRRQLAGCIQSDGDRGGQERADDLLEQHRYASALLCAADLVDQPSCGSGDQHDQGARPDEQG
jgi:hypothetical protein